MFDRLRGSIPHITLLGAIACSIAGTTLGVVQAARSQGTQEFPDVSSDYWAHPFIEVLNERGIVAGYPDGTFRPQQAVDRDEFAAIIRQAFNREQVKTIPRGSVFADVPQNYWAAPPIEEAYETGFMDSYNNNLFKPREEITKLEALVSLARGLDLTYQESTPTAQEQTPAPAAAVAEKPRPIAQNRFAFPLAMTAIMQPFIQPAFANPNPQPANRSPQAAAPNQTQPSGRSAREFLAAYYQDAAQIPDDAIDPVAAVTQAGIVVNHPNVRVLQPNQLLNRGAAAALIYQALTYQNKLEPLQAGNEATQYVVETPSP